MGKRGDDEVWIANDQDGFTADKIAEKKLVRKLDLHIVPPIMLLYLFSFLDRFAPTFTRGGWNRPTSRTLTGEKCKYWQCEALFDGIRLEPPR